MTNILNPIPDNEVDVKPELDAVTDAEQAPTEPTHLPAGHGFKGNSFFRKRLKLIVGVFFFALLSVGGVAAYLLSQSSQDLRQQAAGTAYIKCVTPANCPKGNLCIDGKCSNKKCTGENKQEFQAGNCCAGLVLKRVEICTPIQKILHRCVPVEGGYRECRKP